MTGIFGDRSFRQSIHDDQENMQVVEGLAELIGESVEMDAIVTVVSEVFGVDRKEIVARQAGRREKNTPRRVAMYCGQRHGRCSHKDLAKYFGLSHAGSVSSAIVSVGRQLEAGELEKEIKKIERELNVVKLP